MPAGPFPDLREPPPEVLRAALRRYLRGEALDMRALATELKVSRATLYRRAGNHEQLLARVLADRVVKTFVAAESIVLATDVDPSRERALAILAAFLQAVVDTEPLQMLIARDPVLFARVVMAPGPVESATAEVVAGLLDREIGQAGAGLRESAPVLAQAIVRIGDSFMYTHLLSGGPPRLAEAVAVMRMLLEAAVVPT